VRTGYPYRLSEEVAGHRLGLIVLQVDETIEPEFRRLLSPATTLHVSRIASGAELTPETIAEMEAHLPAAAGLLPPAARFDAVGYACTSGTTLIGAARVAELVGSACTTRTVTDPLTASLRAMQALGARRIGFVSPYVEAVAAPMQAAFEAAGLGVPRAVSFGEEVEACVARIDPASVADAAREVAGQGAVDLVFLSCTNLRTLDVIDALEADLGIPVISSNLALAWDMARRAGATLAPGAPGRLLRL
jgi:maleate isomerase